MKVEIKKTYIFEKKEKIKVYTALKRLEINQDKLSEMINFNKSHINRVLNSKVSASEDFVEKLEKALEIKLI